MAQIEESNRRKSKKNYYSKTLRVDLTPMVDLGFLLITFFMFTTVLSQPTIAKLYLPKDINVKTPIKKSAVLTLMLTRNDSIAWYEGNKIKNEPLAYCNYNNLRSVIQQKQAKVAKVLGNRSETVIIIYPCKESTYENFINIMDEISINDITHYFVMNSKQ